MFDAILASLSPTPALSSGKAVLGSEVSVNGPAGVIAKGCEEGLSVDTSSDLLGILATVQTIIIHDVRIMLSALRCDEYRLL